MFDESAITVFFKSDPQFLLRIHHNRAIPGHRFTYGPARDQ